MKKVDWTREVALQRYRIKESWLCGVREWGQVRGSHKMGAGGFNNPQNEKSKSVFFWHIFTAGNARMGW